MTKPDDNRDSAVERMLRGALEMRDASARQGSCLDADTVAAWADDGLSAEERSTVEAHAADCARCQALLSAMARTTPQTAETSTSWWRAHWIGWLLPLAGVGAAVVIWTIVPDRQIVQPSEATPQVDAVAEAPVTPGSSAPSSPAGDLRSDRREAVAPRRPPADEARAKAPADKKEVASANANSAAGAIAEQALAPSTPPPAAADSTRFTAVPAPAALSARVRASAGDTTIVSSNPGSRWRIVPGGAVQRSADGGSTWQTQQTGVAVTMIAGASPSPSVCWLVGPGGIVLLSTDGQSWHRLAFPETTDLVDVRATDAKTATVTSADGHTFSTDDGGVTWTRAPVQDFPAAPF